VKNVDHLSTLQPKVAKTREYLAKRRFESALYVTRRETPRILHHFAHSYNMILRLPHAGMTLSMRRATLRGQRFDMSDHFETRFSYSSSMSIEQMASPLPDLADEHLCNSSTNLIVQCTVVHSFQPS